LEVNLVQAALDGLGLENVNVTKTIANWWQSNQPPANSEPPTQPGTETQPPKANPPAARSGLPGKEDAAPTLNESPSLAAVQFKEPGIWTRTEPRTPEEEGYYQTAAAWPAADAETKNQFLATPGSFAEHVRRTMEEKGLPVDQIVMAAIYRAVPILVRIDTHPTAPEYQLPVLAQDWLVREWGFGIQPTIVWDIVALAIKGKLGVGPDQALLEGMGVQAIDVQKVVSGIWAQFPELKPVHRQTTRSSSVIAGTPKVQQRGGRVGPAKPPASTGDHTELEVLRNVLLTGAAKPEPAPPPATAAEPEQLPTDSAERLAFYYVGNVNQRRPELRFYTESVREDATRQIMKDLPRERWGNVILALDDALELLGNQQKDNNTFSRLSPLAKKALYSLSQEPLGNPRIVDYGYALYLLDELPEVLLRAFLKGFFIPEIIINADLKLLAHFKSDKNQAPATQAPPRPAESTLPPKAKILDEAA
jgi:hypothetical protein